MQHINLLLKIDNWIVMSYKETFWAYWILLTLISTMVILFLVFLLSNSYVLCNKKINQNAEGEQARYSISVIFVLTVIFGSFLVIFSLMLLNLYKYLDSNKKASYDPICHYVAICWLVVMAITTKVSSNCMRSYKKQAHRHHPHPEQ